MKRCLFLLVIAFGFFAFNGVSQASVNPRKDLRVTRDTTFTKTDSPIDPCGDIIVEPGVTLTIDPGVTVYLSSGMYNRHCLVVYGILKAIGTNEQPIVFKQNTCGWQIGGIVLFDSTSVEGSELRYCRIGYANFGIMSRGTAPTISHCDIDAEGWGIILSGASDLVPYITHCQIRGAPGIFSLNPSPVIMYSTISGSGSVAISLGGESRSQLHYNNLYGKVGGYALDARFNYWGTTDEAKIKKCISGDVDYSGWLLAPVDIMSVIRASWGHVKSLLR